MPLLAPCRTRRRGCRRRRLAAALGASALALVALAAGTPPHPAGADPVRYAPPVDGPVVDPFRPPSVPWGPGNRGVDYATVPLAPVRAAADGEVVFAGRVAGTLHVTVRHADGLRTSYSFLASVELAVGQRVRRGEPLGRAAEVLHFGVRLPDGTYLDPAALFSGPVEVHLEPGGDDGGGGPAAVAETGLLADVTVERWGPVGRLLGLVPGAPAVAGVLADPLAARLRTWEHYAVELLPATHLQRWGRGLYDIVTDRRPCTPAEVGPPPPSGRRILVLVGGFGSSSDGASVEDVDVEALGYDPDDVVRFSYAGGRTARDVHGSPLAALPVTEYHAADTEQDLTVSGDRFAALLAHIAATEPGVPIDIVGHSQGGLVARLGLASADTGGSLPGEVQTLVTLGSPHRGADLATALDAVGQDPGGRALLDGVRSRLGLEVDADSPAAHQLSEVSPLILGTSGRPAPAGVRVTSIGARGDLIVPAGRTAIPAGPGQASTVVGVTGTDAHDRLPADPAATREIALAVAGLPPTCRGVGERFGDLVVADAIGGAEDALAPTATALVTLTPP